MLVGGGVRVMPNEVVESACVAVPDTVTSGTVAESELAVFV